MKISENWFLAELSGVFYLFPLGQAAAERKKTLKLNQTGVFFWNALHACEKLSSFDEEETLGFLLAALKKEEEDLPPDGELRADIRSFLDSLIRAGVLQKTDGPSPAGSAIWLKFGGITVKVEGNPSILSEEFTDFITTPNDPADLTIRFEEDYAVRNPELFVADRPAGVEFRFPNSLRIDRVFLSENADLAVFTLFGPMDDLMKLDLFHAIRLLVSHTAQKKGHFFMHSVSLCYREKAWLFSAPSGTGKSTHAALWKKLWPDEAKDLNGDVNLLQIKDGEPYVHGIPWNGTSGIYSTDTVLLGGIVILKRGTENKAVVPTDDEKQLSVVQRLISPFLTKEQMEKNLRFAGELIRKVPVWHLYCTPEDEAAVVMRRAIDEADDCQKSRIR